jgi:glycosyltransferase involved in cell wall biosynthesis
VPVVLTAIKGLWAPNLLRDDENCLLVPPGDAAAIGAAVQRITQDTALAQRLAMAGRETVLKHFSLSVGERAARDLLAHVPDLRPAKAGTA